jgi:hypothetical protein
MFSPLKKGVGHKRAVPGTARGKTVASLLEGAFVDEE